MMEGERSNKTAILGSIAAAIGVAACCLGPLLLVSLGVTGAWIGNLSALEPYRPLFIVAAAGLIAFGFYRVYGGRRHEECGDGPECDVPRASAINQVSLWIATVVVVGLVASPYLLENEVPSATAAVAGAAESTAPSGRELVTVTFDVEGMTCAGCAHGLRSVLSEIDGVEEVSATFEPPEARVTYDRSRVNVETLVAAIEGVGYSARSRERQR